VRVPHLSPTTLTTVEQRLILRASASNLRDHAIISFALGTGLRLAEIVGQGSVPGAEVCAAHRREGASKTAAEPQHDS
jgi:integrase